MLEAAIEEEPAIRKRAVVHYDDGLTEDQFLRALEDEDVDLNDVVEKKRERAEKRKMKQALSGEGTQDGSQTPEPSSKKKGKGKKGLGASNLNDDDFGDDASNAGSARKRKRGNALSPAGSVDSGGFGGGKRRKGDDPVRQHIAAVLLQCYRAAEACVDETGRKRSMMFQDIPKKTDYPDYHVIIQKPISLRQIKRRLDNKVYKTVSECRDDFHLMAANAKTYNEEGSWVYVDAVELQGAFDAMYNQLVPGSGLPGAEGGGATGGNTGPSSANGQGAGDDDEDDEDDDEEEEEEEAPVPPKPSGMKIKLKRRNEIMDED